MKLPENVEVISLLTYDVKTIKFDIYALAIRIWSYRKSKIKWSDRPNHTIDHAVFKDLNTGIVYNKAFHASKKYSCENFEELMKHYKIINVCNTVQSYKLSKLKMIKKLKRMNSYVGINYGVVTIAGLVAHEFNKRVRWGADKIKTLICSESSIRIYIEEIILTIGKIEYPIDFLDPLERKSYMPMRKYTGKQYYE